MPVQYSQCMKVLCDFLRPGAEFPTEGLGAGNAPGDKAVKALKLMCKHMIRLGVMDEAAAIEGTRPLEQVADCSGIAWGGTCMQMTKDKSGFTILLTAGKG